MPRGPLLDVVLFDIDDTLYSTTAFADDARRNAVAAMISQGLDVTEDGDVERIALRIERRMREGLICKGATI